MKINNCDLLCWYVKCLPENFSADGNNFGIKKEFFQDGGFLLKYWKCVCFVLDDTLESSNLITFF